MRFLFLPDIWIRADVETPLFLSRLKDLAQKLSHCRIDSQDQIGQPPEVGILTLVPITAPDIPEKLCIVLSSDKQENNRVFIEAEANGWRKVHPDYEEYTSLTRRFIDPLLKVYNKRYHSNRRLYVQTKAQLTPKLSQYPAQFFNHFTNNANKSFLSRRSWRHYYKFIICCHRRREYVSSDELEFLIRQAGFGDYYSEKLCVIFEHGWGILEELPDSKLKAWRRQLREKERNAKIGTDNKKMQRTANP